MEFQYISIVGVGRSGTTLLMSMLNSHSKIAFPPEFHFVRNYLSKAVVLPYREAHDALASDPYFERIGIPIDEALGRPLEAEGEIDLVEVYQRILTHFGKLKQAARVGDKDPKNVEHLHLIRAIFDRPYVVHVIRDPRDVYLSRTQADWAKGRSRASHLLAYRAQLLVGRSAARLFGDRYLEVHFEDLVKEPEATLRQLCKDLGLDFEVEMLQHEKSAQELVMKDEMQWKGTALTPVQSSKAGRWRQSDLDRSLLLSIESACSPAFTDGFYSRSVEPSSTFERVAAAVWDRGIDLLSSLYIWKVKRAGVAIAERALARASGRFSLNHRS